MQASKGTDPIFTLYLIFSRLFCLSSSSKCFSTFNHITNSSKYFSKPNFDLELPFRFQLIQNENHNFCEVGRILHFSKFTSQSSHIFWQYLLNGLYNFTKIMFDDYYRYIFDSGGTQLQLLWALKNPLDLRTYPFQEGRDDASTPRIIAWANA